jgi:PAS domain S-box-containing protein
LIRFFLLERPGPVCDALADAIRGVPGAVLTGVAGAADAAGPARAARPHLVVLGPAPGAPRAGLVRDLRDWLGPRPVLIAVGDDDGARAEEFEAGVDAFLGPRPGSWDFAALARSLAGCAPFPLPGRRWLAGFIDVMPLPALLSEPGNGRIVHANALLRDAVGIGAADLAQADVRDFYRDGADRERFMAAVRERRVVQGYEILLRRADGTPLWTLVSTSRIVCQGGDVLLTVFNDITMRKRAETELQVSERHFRRIADVLPAMIHMTDAKGATIFTNRLSREFTGLSEEIMIARGWLSSIHPDDRDGFRKAEAEALAHRIPYEYECRARRADGAWRWTLNRATPYPEADGSFGGLIGVCLDITARREVELALARMTQAVAASNELARIATEGVGLGTWDADLTTSRNTWSERAKVLFGLPPDAEITDALFQSRLHPDDRPVVNDAMRAALDPEGGGSYVAEFRVGLPDGGMRWISSQGFAFFEGGNGRRRPVRMVGTMMDVTARRLAEDRLRASLAEKETLLREVHHRVKNNLQGLWSLLQLEALQLRDPAMRARIEAICSRIVVMGRIHQQLYSSNDFAHIDLGRQLPELALGLLAMEGDPERITLDLEVAPLACDLDTAIPLGLIANELISNSLKHAFPGERGGRLSIRLAPAAGGRVALTVADDGIGAQRGRGREREAGGIGTLLIQALASQIEAEVEEVPVERGCATRILVPDGRFVAVGR